FWDVLGLLARTKQSEILNMCTQSKILNILLVIFTCAIEYSLVVLISISFTIVTTLFEIRPRIWKKGLNIIQSIQMEKGIERFMH
ncbi:hypothetical protein ACJX0J_030888, partial [Zea mays]